MITDAEGNSIYEPTRAIANMDSPTNPTLLMHRIIVENFIKNINNNCPDFFFFEMLGDTRQHREKVRALFPENSAS
ncbi:hypothetical protein H8K32_00095 [Undibacterium jejuense]|uniref:Uncharacterized protein n=1 Tax=Undibacterium jejuense TaxID=1344949 RepID=A0A923KNE8_9BURK|nr:hypothetical protein [Undibacterium jejuense]MBC3860486.1 hypothetical protein [Undibacterium jejuense]